jgi:hypothetical protein
MVQSGSKAFAAAGLAGEHMYSDAFEYAKPNVESPNTGQ